jgi:hypothetical protein
MNKQSSPVDEQRVSVIKPKLLAYGTFVTTNVAKAKLFFEEMVGLETVEPTPGRLLVRDKGKQARGHRGGFDYWTLDIREVATVSHPQKILNHWGIDVADRDAVDHAHAMATLHKERFGLKKVMPVRVQHQSYAFYFQDFDSNWWEVLTRTPGREPEKLFEKKQDLYDKDGAQL